MRRYFYTILAIGLFSLFLISSATAQEAAGLGGYVPPPLFGGQNAPEPYVPPVSPVESSDSKAKDAALNNRSKPTKNKKEIVIEKVDKPQELKSNQEPKSDAVPLLKGRAKVTPVIVPKAEPVMPKKAIEIKKAPKVNVVKPAPKPIPKAQPPKKPIPRIVKEKSINKPVRSGPEPIDLLKKKDIPPPPPVKVEVKKEKPKLVIEKIDPPKVTSEGVVRGPKTMPSNKKQSVDAVVTYDNKTSKPSIMMERVQKQVVAKEKEALETSENIKKIKSRIPLPDLVEQEDGSQKISMLYLEKQSGIKDAQINILEQVIIPELKSNEDVRLIIQAYANSPDDSLNSDRRLALDRALEVREYILSKEIPSNRMDVRSLGSQTNVQPLDRVELYITQ